MECYNTRIWLRADASAEIGYGHFVRLLALGEMLGGGFELVFATRNPTPLQIQQIEAVCSSYVALGDDHSSVFLSLIQPTDIVVLDNYFFDTDYQRKIKERGCKLVCIDDVHDKHYVADVVINQVIGVQASDFSCMPYTRLCLGPQYALLRAPFRTAMSEQRLTEEHTGVLVAMGGSDPKRITERLVALLAGQYAGTISVLIGAQYQGTMDLKQYGVQVYQNLDAMACAALLSAQQVVVVPSSTLSYEAFAIGCAVAVGYYTANQVEAQRNMTAQGLAVGCGDFENISSPLLLHHITTAQTNANTMIARQKALFDGQQSTRLNDLMEGLCR